MNLATNARDAMPRGGVLTFAVEAIEGEVGHPGPWIRLTVRDTGVGMDDGTQKRIFEPFFTTKPRNQGTGLGLATVHGIVAQSGGFVTFESAPGRGTSFFVHFPRGGGTPGAGELAPVVKATRRSATILVVDDQQSIRRLTSELLGNLGYRVLAAATGEEAVQVAEAEPGAIDLLLLDIVLPGMNGREVAERVLARRADARVLYMSGYMDDTPLRAGVRSRRAAFLEKPFRFEQLVAKIEEVLAAPQA
jgi:CheY-like chemotaxis protein